ncbi:hypothetical protein FHG87_022977 [Trinorchestia longiramus]|nr:hypothetical protein FHG87_022977 [Trinorchestia longiramus]
MNGTLTDTVHATGQSSFRDEWPVQSYRDRGLRLARAQRVQTEHNTQGLNTRTQHKQVLDYKRANFELMKEELGSYNYEVLMNNKNAEECYMILKNKIATATDHHIPRKRIRPTNNPPWFLQKIKRLINARQHSYRRLKRYQTEPHRQEHIHACRAVKRTIKSTKRNKEITVTAQATTIPKSFYKYVNDRRLKRDTIGPLIDSEGSTQTNNKSKAKILNTYFTSVFTHEDLTEIPQPHVLKSGNHVRWRIYSKRGRGTAQHFKPI